jgi:MoaA/NifB/PqqE/SkfB family radical SAM enzyme
MAGVKIDPQTVRLEAATVCQLHCPDCSTGQGQETISGKDYLKIADFKEFIADNPRIKQIELAGHGEIFLNPDLLRIIKYAYEKRVRLTANVGVNLNYLTFEVAEALIRYKFRSMICAIDGASQETYKIYRVGGDFNKVIENINTINFYKQKYRSKFPLLHWQFVIFGHNEHELPLAKNMAKRLNMSFVAHLAWNNSFSPVKNKNFIRKETGLYNVTREDYYKNTGKPINREMCKQLWIDPLINWDGRVFGCCTNFWGDFGNAFEYRLLEILNNAKMNYARNMLMGKRPPQDDIPCIHCPVYLRIKNDKTWIKLLEIKKRMWRRKLQNFFFELMPTSIINKIVNLFGSRRTSL